MRIARLGPWTTREILHEYRGLFAFTDNTKPRYRPNVQARLAGTRSIPLVVKNMLKRDRLIRPCRRLHARCTVLAVEVREVIITLRVIRPLK